ncbi:MAG TPA: (2Fe-2S)-binding protein [Dongiaceae bacterium]|jgi:predicted molibdopterin-dependent oxidoreductase YjgC|nr:(2Fe-2S)-binding protein [Dongiaceae bacterium]
MKPAGGILRRIAERDRGRITLIVDGEPISAFEGDTVLSAILTVDAALRYSEFDGAPRAGFCLMGACQECRVGIDGHGLQRACMTAALDGMAVTRDRWRVADD